MRHFIIFKYGKFFWEKIYEYHGDLDTAREFQKALSKNDKTLYMLVEVI